MTEVENLEKKAWYRFFKLCYLFAYVLSVSVVLFAAYQDRPTEYIDSDSSIIRCANGKEYSAGAISSYFARSQLDAYDDEKARKLCTTPDLPLDVIELNKNYIFIPVKSIRGSYATLFWGFGTVILVGEVIRRSFLYVVAGRSFFHVLPFIK